MMTLPARMDRRGSAAKVVVIGLLVMAVICGVCGGIVILAPNTIEQARGPRLVHKFTLTAPDGTDPADLEKTLAVLKERLDAVGIDNQIDRLDRKFSVRLPEDSTKVARAAQLLLAGGDLWFKLVARADIDISQADWEQAREQASSDSSAAAYEVLEYQGEPVLLEQPGYPGYLVSRAEVNFDEPQGSAVTTLAKRVASGSSTLFLDSTSGIEPGQMLRVSATVPETGASGNLRTHEKMLGSGVVLDVGPGNSVLLDNAMTASAKAGARVARGFFEVVYWMSQSDAQQYYDYVSSALSRQEATILDGEIVTTATWGSKIPPFKSDIPWYWQSTATPWSYDQAENFATLMTSGRLPVELLLEEE